MTSPFWHTQHGVSSPLWNTPQRATRRPERPDAPSSNRPRGPNTSIQRTRIETQCNYPDQGSRPPLRSRYTSPEDGLKKDTPTTVPRRSSGSPERAYSSSTRPYDRCRSPVMTLRILSPSRQGGRDGKKQEDQENRQVQAPPKPPPVPSLGLSRSTNTKLTSPKRRRLPLRDSILLKRKDTPDSSNAATPTSVNTPQKAPTTPADRVGLLKNGSQPPTPSKSRLIGVPRLGVFSRDKKQARSQEPSHTDQSPRREEPVANKTLPAPPVEAPSDPGERLVSRICSMILDEGFGASPDKSTTPLKVWDAVVKCLDDISRVTQAEASGKRPGSNTALRNSSQPTATAKHSPPVSKNPWPTESSGARENDKANKASEGRQAGEYRREGGATENMPRLVSPTNQGSDNLKRGQLSPLPCPFRARNPARFNVTESWHCAQGQWKNLFELQQHIARHHKHPSDAQLFQCPRCEKGFAEPSAFKDHLMLPREQMCDPRSNVASPSSDPEDGITAGRARALSEGVERGKIGSWDDLWKCLFPGDRMVPRPAILPAIELPQVEQEVFATSNMASLKNSLEERLRFLASQSANSDLFSAQIPVITGSISLVVEAHLRSVFIACRSQPPTLNNRTRPASQPQETTNRPRNLSSSSASSTRPLEAFERRRTTADVNEIGGSTRDSARPQMHAQRSNSDDARHTKIPRAAALPVPSMLTIPFPRISALTEQSDAAPSRVSEDGNISHKGHASDGDYSSGVESNPTSAGGQRDSNNTDIRCSKCNMRPSLRPDEDIFSERHVSGSPVRGTQDSSCRFSDSGIGILCKNCRMLEDLINSYSRTWSQSGKSERRDERQQGIGLAQPMVPFSPDSSVSIDENDEETLFDLILDSATYVDEDGQRKTLVSPMLPQRQDLPRGFSEYPRYGHDRNFF